ncbi:uncharacterized protein [Triticum aestivum]|uniref:uncharacterized protein n=1 Tax=Triticum aestivum TaxID=4565 RepID=UPI001D01A7A9|nr:uncharacterized protein LOC123134085 [Triticum aestivum]
MSAMPPPRHTSSAQLPFILLQYMWIGYWWIDQLLAHLVYGVLLMSGFRRDPETNAAPVIDYVTDDRSFAAELPDDGAPETAATAADYYYTDDAFSHVMDADDQE